MKTIRCLIVVIVFLIVSLSLFTQERQIKVVKKPKNITYSKKRALVIGIDAYPTMPLEAAVADASAVSARLKELDFEVTTLLDREATLKAMRHELGTQLAKTNANDQVIIYFAGHGITEQLHSNRKEGYILPVDVNLKDLYSTAVSMEELRDLTRRIPARHILYVFDCCYSGLGLTRAGRPSSRDLGKYLEELQGKRAVYMITAGKANEVAREVRGHGLFTLHFLDGIAGNADKNSDGIVQATELGNYLAGVVSRDSRGDQNPQHGLLEGDGDYLFPLQAGDPIRLKQSLLAKLDFQLNELSKRKSLQEEYNRFHKKIEKSGEIIDDEYSRVIEGLDNQIKQKQEEINSLKQFFPGKSEADLSQQRYSVMKFLNTGVEFDILKTFPDVQEANEYYSEVFGAEVDLDKAGYSGIMPSEIWAKIEEKLIKANPYKTKVPSYGKGGAARERYNMGIYPKQGLIGSLYIKTQTVSSVVQKLKSIPSPLHDDHTTIVEKIKFEMNDIDSNDKLLTFDQIFERMVARYGNPTSKSYKTDRIKNWKTGEYERHPMYIWENEDVRLTLKPINRNDLLFEIYNKTPVIKEIFNHAYKMVETEQFILLKQRIAEMAELERKKAKEAKKIKF